MWCCTGQRKFKIMSKTLVKFKKGYGRYNKGETAAFEDDVAEKLCNGDGSVATKVRKVKPAPVSADGDGSAAQISALTSEVSDLTAQVEAKDEQIAQLTADLDAAKKKASETPSAPQKTPGEPPKTKA
jgi:hypothetical protein